MCRETFGGTVASTTGKTGVWGREATHSTQMAFWQLGLWCLGSQVVWTIGINGLLLLQKNRKVLAEPEEEILITWLERKPISNSKSSPWPRSWNIKIVCSVTYILTTLQSWHHCPKTYNTTTNHPHLCLKYSTLLVLLFLSFPPPMPPPTAPRFSSNLGAFLLMTRLACGSSWKLSCSSASRALRARRRRAPSSRTRRLEASFRRPDSRDVMVEFRVGVDGGSSCSGGGGSGGVGAWLTQLGYPFTDFLLFFRWWMTGWFDWIN